MEVIGRLLYLLVLLAVGIGLRGVGLLDETWTARLNAVAYFVALPALIFVSTYDQSIGELLSVALLAGLLIVLFTTAILAWVVNRNRSSGPLRSVAIIQSYHSNLGYLGLPLIAATFDAEVTATASVILGVVSLIQVPMTIIVLTRINGASTSIRRELGRIVTNPVLAALLAGIAVGAGNLWTPTPVTVGLDAVAGLALPLALLCVGASLRLEIPSVNLDASAWVLALNVGWMPLIAWVVFSMLAVDSATFAAAIVMFGTPTAVSTFVFAVELGGDEEFASLNVFLTTVVSVVTLFVLVTLVG